MLDIVSDIAILLGAPKVILPFTLFLFVTLCQAILMYMKNKKDTMWMLKWTDDICFVNLQWLFSLFIVVLWIPIYYWSEFLRDRWILQHRMLGWILPLAFVIITSICLINVLRDCAYRRYLKDCQEEGVKIKRVNLFDILCIFVGICGITFTGCCLIIGLSWSMFLEQYGSIARVLYWIWQIYFIFSGVGMQVKRIGKFILRFGIIGKAR